MNLLRHLLKIAAGSLCGLTTKNHFVNSSNGELANVHPLPRVPNPDVTWLPHQCSGSSIWSQSFLGPSSQV